MIKQETARDIFNCYAEIARVEKLLEDVEKQEQSIQEQQEEKTTNRIQDRYCAYQLGIPRVFSSENTAYTLLYVNPSLAKAVMIEHYAGQKARLAELNQRAKLEVENGEA